MGVEDVELPTPVTQIAETDPRHHAQPVRTPGVRGDHVWRVREPEVVELDRRQASGVVEDRHELVLTAAPAPGADPVVVTAEILLDHAELLVEPLLGADEMGALAA